MPGWIWRFSWRLVRNLLVAALVAAIPVVWALVAVNDRRETLAGHHGTMTIRRCEGAGDRWTCHGSFRSDDTEITIADIAAEFGNDPGELAEGWVADGTATTMHRGVISEGQGRLLVIVAWVVSGICVLVAIHAAAVGATDENW